MITTSKYCFRKILNEMLRWLKNSKINLFFNQISATPEFGEFKMMKKYERSMTEQWQVESLKNGVKITHPKVDWELFEGLTEAGDLTDGLTEGKYITVYGYCVSAGEQLLYYELFDTPFFGVRPGDTIIVTPCYLLGNDGEGGAKMISNRAIFVIGLAVIIGMGILDIYLGV